MAGPAIRAVELARQLSDECRVTVFSPCRSELEPDALGCVQLAAGLSKTQLYKLANSCDIIYVQANALKPYPELARLGKYLIVDLYDPYLLSLLAQYADDPHSSSASYRLMHQVLEKHMVLADFSICASQRQRDYWLGRYCAIGRLTPELYKFDPTFRKLLDVVPFGLPGDAPVKNGPGIKGVVPGIATDDQVLLWGGGIWQWFDPLTVIEAVAQLSKTRANLKLFFMGWKSPNPQVPLMEMALQAKQLAERLGVLNTNVIFHESWVPYDQRVNYLLGADIAVSAHFDLPETRFAFRTRILDYLWAGLPIITTGGDQLAEMISARGAGLSLPYGDVSAWVSAIESIVNSKVLSDQLRSGSRALSKEFTWEIACKPIKEFCRHPHHLPMYRRVRMPTLAERARAVYERGGAGMVAKRTQELLRDLLRR